MLQSRLLLVTLHIWSPSCLPQSNLQNQTLPQKQTKKQKPNKKQNNHPHNEQTKQTNKKPKNLIKN